MARQTEDYVFAVFLGGFTSYMRNGWSVTLRAIENCIFSIRSIERNMRPILRTVHPIRCDSPLKIVMAVLDTFFEFELAGLGVTTCC